MNLSTPPSPEFWWDSVDESITIPAGFSDSFDLVTRTFSYGVALSEGLTGSALGESFADCMAAYGDYLGGGDVWIMGDTMPPVLQRDLSDPYSHGAADWFLDTNGNAMHDSGVSSLAFYLMSEGGTHPRGKSTIDVPSIGIGNAADILYETLLTKYNASSYFTSASGDQMDVAFDLYGYAAQAAVAAAWHAVGVSDHFWGWDMAAPMPQSGRTYMGGAFFELSGAFTLDSDNRHYTPQGFDWATGAVDLRCDDTWDWYWTSAEVFPWYWSYTGTTWRVFNGTFQP